MSHLAFSSAWLYQQSYYQDTALHPIRGRVKPEWL